MSSSPELSVLLSNEAIRQAIISKLTEGGVPTDPDSVLLLNTLLTASDRTALGRMRIKVDAKQNDNQERILQLAQQVLKSAHGRDIFCDPDGVTGNIPNSPATIIDVTPVDGELAIGIENNEYNSFMGSFKK